MAENDGVVERQLKVGNAEVTVQDGKIILRVGEQYRVLTAKGEVNALAREFKTAGSESVVMGGFTTGAMDIKQMLPSNIVNPNPPRSIAIPLMPILSLVQNAIPIIAMGLALSAVQGGANA